MIVKFLIEEGRKESNSDLKEKVAANFDTKKLIQF